MKYGAVEIVYTTACWKCESITVKKKKKNTQNLKLLCNTYCVFIGLLVANEILYLCA